MTGRRGIAPRSSTRRHAARGFGAIAAIVVLVLLAALAAAIVRIGGGAQASQAQDLLGARAWQAARAGTEWGVYQALKGNWTSCVNASQTLDLRADSGGMRVTVSCSSISYNEGEASPGVAQLRRAFTIDAVACNSTSCPDDTLAVQAGYVERRRQVQLVQ
jgi:MSHA biogenesis protein MshP